jgi:hypothetical protein
MRTIRGYGYCLLLVQLLGIVGCEERKYQPVYTGVDVTVKFNNCVATPDWQPLHLKDRVTWKIDPAETPSHTYSINFTTSPVPSSTYTVSPGPGTSPQTVAGSAQCGASPYPPPSSTNVSCYFPYKLIQDGTTSCPDPGLHVTP